MNQRCELELMAGAHLDFISLFPQEVRLFDTFFEVDWRIGIHRKKHRRVQRRFSAKQDTGFHWNLIETVQ